jgi:hypothetical protein
MKTARAGGARGGIVLRDCCRFAVELLQNPQQEKEWPECLRVLPGFLDRGSFAPRLFQSARHRNIVNGWLPGRGCEIPAAHAGKTGRPS